MRRLALRLSGIVLVAWVGAAVALDRYGASADPSGPYDYVVVAGAGVMPGGVPGDALVVRTEKAVELWRAGHAPKVAFTGGVGDWGPAEAVVGANLARELGLAEEAIVREERSTSTAENASELRAIVGDAHILVVTDNYHVLRCDRVFGRHFSRVDVVGATSPPFIRGRGALREVLAIAWYAAQGRL
jgi:uncharacterized SAM-binding protein YcdF (DUF218 family)